jgi:hypothetical protein
MTETCETCRFYHHQEGAPAGQCRRSPPIIAQTVIIVEGPRFISAWPPVHGTAFCGEYQQMVLPVKAGGSN